MAVQTYTVHEPAAGPRDRLELGETLVFVRDGFSWAAALFGPLWMILYRLWLPLIVYVGIIIGLEVLVRLAGVPDQVATWIVVAMHVLIGFEGDSLRRRGLRRRGYSMIGSVSGRSREECERRFFDAWLDGQPYVATGVSSPSPFPMGTGGRLTPMALRPDRV